MGYASPPSSPEHYGVCPRPRDVGDDQRCSVRHKQPFHDAGNASHDAECRKQCTIWRGVTYVMHQMMRRNVGSALYHVT